MAANYRRSGCKSLSSLLDKKNFDAVFMIRFERSSKSTYPSSPGAIMGVKALRFAFTVRVFFTSQVY